MVCLHSEGDGWDVRGLGEILSVFLLVSLKNRSDCAGNTTLSVETLVFFSFTSNGNIRKKNL